MDHAVTTADPASAAEMASEAIPHEDPYALCAFENVEHTILLPKDLPKGSRPFAAYPD